MKKNSQIGKDVLFTNCCSGAAKPKTKAHNSQFSKSLKSTKLQYFPCGTANCSVHHYTGQNKISSPHAVFYNASPLYTGSRFEKRTDYRKAKSDIDFSSMPAKYSSHPIIGKGASISKNLKQTKLTVKPDPEFPPIIRGNSLKLKPKKGIQKSDIHTLLNCQNVKCCKVCGEVMPGTVIGLQASSAKKHSTRQLDEESCLDCKVGGMLSLVDYTEKIERMMSNSEKRQCIICSTRYYNFSGTKLCEKCVKVIKNQANDAGVTPSFEEHVDKDTFSSVKTNPDSKIKKVFYIHTEDDRITRFADCEISHDINTTSVTKQIKKQANDLTQKSCSTSDLDDKHPNNANLHTSTKRSNLVNQTTLASQLDHEFQSTVIAGPSLGYHKRKCSSEDEITLSATENPIYQNVLINNYHFLKDCNICKMERNASSSNCSVHSSASPQQFLFENALLTSQSEDSLEIDKLDISKNKFSSCNYFGYQTCHEKQHSSTSRGPSLQHEFPITFRSDSSHTLINDADGFKCGFMCGMFESRYGKVSLPEDILLTLECDRNSIPNEFSGKKNNFYQNIERYETDSNSSTLSFKNELRSHNQKDSDCLSDTKAINPYIEKSLVILNEMLSLRNEAIDPDEILGELKRNQSLMKAVNQMAAKKLNFHKNSAVFKTLPPK